MTLKTISHSHCENSLPWTGLSPLSPTNELPLGLAPQILGPQGPPHNCPVQSSVPLQACDMGGGKAKTDGLSTPAASAEALLLGSMDTALLSPPLALL